MVPHFEPRTLNVLVVPGFPLPYSRMSIPKKNLLIQTAVGMEPIRYAARISRTSIIDQWLSWTHRGWFSTKFAHPRCAGYWMGLSANEPRGSFGWITNLLKNHLIS